MGCGHLEIERLFETALITLPQLSITLSCFTTGTDFDFLIKGLEENILTLSLPESNLESYNGMLVPVRTCVGLHQCINRKLMWVCLTL